MNDKNYKMLLAIGEVDEKYVKEAEADTRGLRHTALATAASFIVMIGLALHLFIPFAPVAADVSEYSGSPYFSLIESIENYLVEFKQPIHKNNFEKLLSNLSDTFTSDDYYSTPESDPAADSVGDSYVEVTDNQVEGVVEADLFKMTDKYIFRLDRSGERLYVYSVDKENSEQINCVYLPSLRGLSKWDGYGKAQMLLSADCNTLLVIKPYVELDGKRCLGVALLDVDDVKDISLKSSVAIQGTLNTCRLVDGKLLLVSDYYFNDRRVDYNDPKTFVPSIDCGNGFIPLDVSDIIFTSDVDSIKYSTVALLDAQSLEVLDTKAALDFDSNIYVSGENMYITRECERTYRTNEKWYDLCISDTTDIAILDYSDGKLEYEGTITVKGSIDNQYNLDERDGYLRAVTSTRDTYVNNGILANTKLKENVSLYVFDLADRSLAYSVEDFAIEGERATAVRFDGDMLYVCSAEVVSYKDPVYFFDLSDYENITSTDTGVIDGFSSSLIDLCDGFLLGIGVENDGLNKVEIYKEDGGKVTSVDKFLFGGGYSSDYKAYLVNREACLFGLAVEASPFNRIRYLLFEFDGTRINNIVNLLLDRSAHYSRFCDDVRAVYRDGYLYITSSDDLKVVKVEE